MRVCYEERVGAPHLLPHELLPRDYYRALMYNGYVFEYTAVGRSKIVQRVISYCCTVERWHGRQGIPGTYVTGDPENGCSFFQKVVTRRDILLVLFLVALLAWRLPLCPQRSGVEYCCSMSALLRQTIARRATATMDL